MKKIVCILIVAALMLNAAAFAENAAEASPSKTPEASLSPSPTDAVRTSETPEATFTPEPTATLEPTFTPGPTPLAGDFPVHFSYATYERELENQEGFKELRFYPVTVSEKINKILAQKIDEMAENARQSVPKGDKSKRKVFETSPYMRRTGESLMSFLLASEVFSNGKTHHFDYFCRNYDLLFEKEIALSDIININDDIKLEVLRQFLEYFSFEKDRQTDELERLVLKSFEQLPFTMDAARLCFHLPSKYLKPDNKGLMHAYIYYMDIRDSLTEYGRRQTDNSMYTSVALTFDDGPTGMNAVNVMRSLKSYGGGGSFFLIGQSIKSREDVLASMFNKGFSVCYHSHTHKIGALMKPERIFKEIELNNQSLLPVTGIRQTIMRPPGGAFGRYTKAKVPYAILNWTKSIGSLQYKNDTYKSIARGVGKKFQDGGIVLIHDTRPREVEMTEIIARELYNRGVLIVSVEELFALKGIKLRDGILYIDACRERLPQIIEKHARLDKKQ